MVERPETAPYLEAFRDRIGAREPGWLEKSRKDALARFAELGFPSRREEAWRFSDLRPLASVSFPPAGAGTRATAEADIAPWRLAAPAHRIVLVDGRFVPALSDVGSLPKGAYLASTERALAERPDFLRDAASENSAARQSFAALNAAFFADGFVLALDPGTTLDRPVEVIHLSRADRPLSFHLRNLVVLGEKSSAKLVETFAGEGQGWTNVVTALQIGAGASLAHLRVQDEGAQSLHMSFYRAALARGATYESFALTLGARLSRHDVALRFDGPEASARLDGVFCLRGRQEATTATFVDHAAPQCVTRELWKGVVDDEAHGVFLGRIAVRPDAQKSDAQQVNRNLLLSRRAAVDTKPELEILADDVKCSHGATVGDLDEEALFYLRARGIEEDEARRMLIEAFAVDALEGVADAALKSHAAARLGRWLAREER
jgi:Fe-S cluster assembly protein SufD